MTEKFDAIAIEKLAQAEQMHVDETGVNINGKGLWLHSASNALWTHFRPHESRDTKAMNEIGVVPRFRGILCHDHFKPYFTYILVSHE